MTELDTVSVVPYLRGRGLLGLTEEPTVRALGGGVSSAVLLVELEGYAPFVVKQALPRLRVQAEWLIDVRRSATERACLRYLAPILGPVRLPSVLDGDDELHVTVMTAAPAGSETWKAQLLAGTVDPLVAERTGAMLAAIHAGAAGDEAARALFADNEIFVQARVDAYHGETARRRPELRAALEAEIARLLAARHTLVTGDFSPKNLLVHEREPFLIDVEIAHWGDPAFDLGFCLTHLAAKTIARTGDPDALIGAARALWDAYRANVAAALVAAWGVERTVPVSLGAILAARVDGKSPLEYLDEPTRERVRAVATSLLLEPASSVEDALARVRSAA